MISWYHIMTIDQSLKFLGFLCSQLSPAEVWNLQGPEHLAELQRPRRKIHEPLGWAMDVEVHHVGVSQNVWFLLGKIPIYYGWWLGVPLFQETSMCLARFIFIFQSRFFRKHHHFKRVHGRHSSILHNYFPATGSNANVGSRSTPPRGGSAREAWHQALHGGPWI